MRPVRNIFAGLVAGTPAFFTIAAWSLPVLLGVQFVLAGQALFNGLPWAVHGLIGTLVVVPILALLTGALGVRRLSGFRWLAGVLAVLYLMQVALAAGGSAALAVHPVNAALLLACSLVVLAKVERRRGRFAD